MQNQKDLFGKIIVDNNPLNNIEGLNYLPNYITFPEEAKIVEAIDNADWMTDLKRRVQHYGFKYDYRARRIDVSMKLGDLPFWATQIAERLFDDGFFRNVPDQLIVNEYLPGQGISPHIDCEPCFEDTIVSLSLLSDITMDFTQDFEKKKFSLPLRKRSLVVLQGDSRYKWKHSIAPRKSDKFDKQTVKRSRRISLTFRSVIID